MTDKVTIKLVGPEQRQRAYQALLRAPADYVVTIREPNRTLDQNAKMHAMLSDVAKAKPEGRELSADVWKSLFMHDAGFKCTFEISEERRVGKEGVSPSTSRLSPYL